jgi:hypothetical protein
LPADIDSALGDLRRLGFEITVLDGARMGSAEEFHTEAAAAFGFPDRYGANWEAFNDCLGDLARRLVPTPADQAVRSASIVDVLTRPETARARSLSDVTKTSACSCVSATNSASYVVAHPS